MSNQDEFDHYSMVLEWDPRDDIYIVTVPELPGCRTHGATREEAVKHGREVIELWIESVRDSGDPVPPPRFFAPSIDAPSETVRAG